MKYHYVVVLENSDSLSTHIIINHPAFKVHELTDLGNSLSNESIKAICVSHDMAIIRLFLKENFSDLSLRPVEINLVLSDI